MKRFLFLLALTIVGFLVLSASFYRVRQRPPVMVHTVIGPDGQSVRTAYVDRHGRVIQLIPAAHEVHDEATAAFEADSGDDQVVHREPAEGLPVPVVPGTRTTEARSEPPSPGRSETFEYRVRHKAPPASPPRVGPPDIRVFPDRNLTTVTGRLSATEERARDDARRAFERLLAARLAPAVPRTWKVPAEMVDGLIRQVTVVPRERDYGTVYEATLKVDLSPSRLAEIVEVYHREQVVKRLMALGALLAFVLVCLAAVSGYIRADEATRGYYTTRLRLAAAAGVAAAGVILYRKLA